MALLEIPIQNGLHTFREIATIENTVYVLEFYFNQRSNHWILDILDEAETPLLLGVPVQTNVPITINFQHLPIPQGILIPFDIQGKSKNADVDDIGIRIKLLYEESENA